jgi:hypothetical protein
MKNIKFINMAKNTNLLNLAKGTATKKAAPAKKPATKVVEKVLTPEEKRDIKAKETVKDLLDGVNLEITAPKKEDLLEVEEGEPKSGDIWLQEQVALLASENEVLKSELAVAKIDYQKIFNENQAIKNGAGIQNDGDLKGGVLTLFHEIQSNYIKMGFDPMTHNPNLIIPPAAFMNRMILFFPFLQKEKRF